MSNELQESLHRLIKQAIDSGQASSIEEAELRFRGYRLHFSMGESHSVADQAALLTGVALARRVFLGGVTVSGTLSAPLLVPMPLGQTLREAVMALGSCEVERDPLGTPTVVIGGGQRERQDGFFVRAVYEGWRGGVVPAHSELTLDASSAIELSGMLAAALAVNEAFLHVAAIAPAAGHRAVGLSLWNPSTADWTAADESEPALKYLPSSLWLMGLGHLGQAFLWALGLLPYGPGRALNLMLQDVDLVTPSSESTCILTDQWMCGRRKTRVMAEWAERRGFKTSICERLFDGSFRRQNGEPAVALCGIDNALGRRALDQGGFDFIVEAGLGRNHQEFSSIRLHTLPGPRAATELWSDGINPSETSDKAAYQGLLKKGVLDQCGITLLAGKAVGAPFVGATAACLVISELLRVLHEGPHHTVVEMDLQSIEHRSAVARKAGAPPINIGFVRCN